MSRATTTAFAVDIEETTVILPDLRTHPDVTAMRAQLHRAVDQLSPAEGAPALDPCQERVRHALQAVVADVEADPTLGLVFQVQRHVELLTELVRQIRPLLRQAAAIEAERLDQDTTLTERERRLALARLGRLNPAARAEAEHMATRVQEIAAQVHAAVEPHWQTPEHRARLAQAHLDHQLLDKAAAYVRGAVSAAAAIDPHLPQVQALRAMATTLDEAAGLRPCAAPGCTEPLPAAEPGRTRRYCSPRCRTRARRAVTKR